jgi:hypothetical protein
MLLKLRQKGLPSLLQGAASEPRPSRNLLIPNGIYQSDTTCPPTQFWPLTCTSTPRRTMGRSLPC